MAQNIKMAARLIESFLECRISFEDVSTFLKSNDCTGLSGKINITRLDNTTLIYELIDFVREQSLNLLEGAPKTVNLLSPRKERPATITTNYPKISDGVKSNVSRQLLPDSTPSHDAPKAKIQSTSTPISAESSSPTFRQNLFSTPPLTSPLSSTPKSTERSGIESKVFSREEFPSLDASTPIAKKNARRVSLNSTPLHGKSLSSNTGDISMASAPLSSESIFQRSIPSTSNTKAKRRTIAVLDLTRTEADIIKDSSSPKKRIVPTPVKQWQHTTLSDFISAEISSSPGDVTRQQRNLCRNINDKQILKDTVTSYEVPVIDLVTFKAKLELLSDLYSYCLLANLVPNISLEIFFLLQLLAVKVRKEDFRVNLLLGTISNSVFFSTNVLLKCKALLPLLQRPTLELLKNIPFMKSFSPDLFHELSCLCASEQSFSHLKSSFIQGVSFEVATDNVDNFPTQNLFSAFRKQRDAFYELLRDWNESQFGLSSNTQSFPVRIQNIFRISMDPCNILHLAKLFVLQMVASCCSSLETDELGNTSEVLQEFRNKSPTKLSRLEGRLEQPSTPVSPTLTHQFTGQQVFFQMFIIEANISVFHCHLKNILVQQIIDEEKIDFCTEDAETSIDSQIREELCSLMYRLKLYGAFLGLIEFLPYTSTAPVRLQVIESMRLSREHSGLLLDLNDKLQESLKEKRLIITLSWVVGFLCMADIVVTRLPQYQSTLTLLTTIFRSCGSSLSNSHMLIKLMLGWLFHILSIPVSFSGACIDIRVSDELESFVDIQLIHMLCPFMQQLKLILVDYYSVKINDIRKIVPVSAANISNTEPGGMENRLEECFFFVNSASVKKNVMFVSERVSSNVVKSCKGEIVKQIKTDIAKSMEEVAASEELQTANILLNLAANICGKMHLKAENMIISQCRTQIANLKHFISSECDADGLEVALKICDKYCHRRVLQWIRTTITKEFILDEINKFKKQCPPPIVDEKKMIDRPVISHLCSPSVGHVINVLTQEILNHLNGLPAKDINDVIEECRLCINHRREWTSSTMKVVFSLVIDLAVATIISSQSDALAHQLLNVIFDNEFAQSFPFDTNVNSVKNRGLIKCYSKDVNLLQTLSKLEDFIKYRVGVCKGGLISE